MLFSKSLLTFSTLLAPLALAIPTPHSANSLLDKRCNVQEACQLLVCQILASPQQDVNVGCFAFLTRGVRLTEGL